MLRSEYAQGGVVATRFITEFDTLLPAQTVFGQNDRKLSPVHAL